jgi:1-acyl-sn-glycerol-3-phosphate acyltransferase
MQPFRPSLFASLFPPIPRVKVQPVAIDYGEEAHDIAWVNDEPAGANATRILNRRKPIAVTLHFLEPIDPHQAGDRKTLARRVEQEIAAVLMPSGRPESPLYPRG